MAGTSTTLAILGMYSGSLCSAKMSIQSKPLWRHSRACCRSAKPPLIQQHLIQLTVLRTFSLRIAERLWALMVFGCAAAGRRCCRRTCRCSSIPAPFLAVAERGDAAGLAFPHAGGMHRHPRMLDEFFQRHLQLEADGVGRIAPMDAEQRRQVFHLLLGRVVEDQQGQLPLARDAVGSDSSRRSPSALPACGTRFRCYPTPAAPAVNCGYRRWHSFRECR